MKFRTSVKKPANRGSLCRRTVSCPIRDRGVAAHVTGGYLDHVHALVFFSHDQAVSKVVRLLKGESSHWANQERVSRRKLEWQDDYAAFFVSESAVPVIRAYIRNQEQHHRKKSFTEEYQELVKSHGLAEVTEG